MDKVKEIISAYYKPLRIYFKDRKPASVTDEQHVLEHIDAFEKIKPYFEKYLYGVWENYYAYAEKKPDYPYLGSFVGFHLIDEMLSNIHNYVLKEDISKQRFLLEYADLFETVAKEEGCKVLIQRDKGDDGKTFAYAYNFIKGDPKFGDSYYTPKEEKELTQHYYNLIKDEINK